MTRKLSSGQTAPKLGRRLCVQLEQIWQARASVREHCIYRIVRVYYTYKDQWDPFLEENLQPVVNAAIPTTLLVYARYLARHGHRPLRR